MAEEKEGGWEGKKEWDGWKEKGKCVERRNEMVARK